MGTANVMLEHKSRLGLELSLLFLAHPMQRSLEIQMVATGEAFYLVWPGTEGPDSLSQP